MSTEILKGSGRGDPSPRITDVVDSRRLAFEQQRQAEKDAEIKAAVDEIQHRRFIQEHTPPRPPVPTDPVEQLHAEWARDKWLAEVEESRRLPERLAELEEWGRKAELEMLLSPPAPKPPTRFGKTLSPAQLAHERTLLDAQCARQAKAAARCGFCMACRTGGEFPCLHR